MSESRDLTMKVGEAGVGQLMTGELKYEQHSIIACSKTLFN